MANIDRPNGLRPIRTLSGSPWSSSVETFAVDVSNATAIFIGDLVSAVIGVCVGVVVDRDVAATEHPGYLPATTAGNIQVVTAKDCVYEIQEDSVGGAMVATNLNTNGDVAAGAGSTTTGRSAYELDSSDVIANDASAATAQLRVLALSSRPDNEIGTEAKWEVVINEHQRADSSIGL